MKNRGLVKEGIVFLKLFKESVLFAFSQLKTDRFRTLLSLLGVSIGIFSIVAVFSAIDALRENVQKGFDSFGSDVVTISKWPFSGEDDYGNADYSAEYKWWEYMRRPLPSERDYKFLRTNSTAAEAVAMEIQFNATLKYSSNSIQKSAVRAVCGDWSKISEVNLQMGRYFTEHELESSNPIGIIGHDVWLELFGGGDPVGKRIKVGNKEIFVIGVFAKQGESMVNVGSGTDLSVLMPLNAGRYMVNPKWADVSIYAKPKEGVSEQSFCDELGVLMRSHRRLAPGDKNNFSINRMTFLIEIVESIISAINLAGWIIAGFSLLIGGFGIANIMFVSVKERTNIIGIQKALGAKRYVILIQFLTEAVVLSVAGGAVGIIMVWLVISMIPQEAAFQLGISAQNVLAGLVISSVIGIVSGISPAMSAAKLNPVDAINAK